MIRPLAPLLALFLIASLAHAEPVPHGALPELDGAWSAGEWDGCLTAKLPSGEARLRIAGRALCLGVRMEQPYAGERIDLYVATKSGRSFCVHSLHPASTLPRLPFAPLPPVLARRGAWDKRAEASFAAPYAAKFRARVLQEDEKAWTAEFAVSYDALNLPAGQPAVFHVRVVDPAARDAGPLTQPPGEWSPFEARPEPDAPLFETAEEDTRNKTAFEFFHDDAVGKVLERKFDPDAALRLADRCDGDNFHDLWFRLHILRRANRLDDARLALRKLEERFPRARDLRAVVSERRQFLLLRHDFATLREIDSGRGVDAVEASWEQEKAMRAKDEALLPRVVLETSQGDVTVAIFRPDSPKLADAVLAWFRAGHCEKARAAWATGGVGCAFPAPRPPEDAKPTGRRAWRGTLAFVVEKDGNLRLLLTTGDVHLYRDASAIGRVVEGQDVVDRLGAADTIRTVRVP